MYTDNYTYSAVMDYSEPGFINIVFPEFNGLATCVGEDEDPIEQAQDCLALTILDLEEKRESLPKRLDERDIDLSEGQKLVYINIWMPFHRSKTKEIYTKKTLTIPVWLDILAKQNNINFSETLVEALKQKLICNDRS